MLSGLQVLGVLLVAALVYGLAVVLLLDWSHDHHHPDHVDPPRNRPHHHPEDHP